MYLSDYKKLRERVVRSKQAANTYPPVSVSVVSDLIKNGTQTQHTPKLNRKTNERTNRCSSRPRAAKAGQENGARRRRTTQGRTRANQQRVKGKHRLKYTGVIN